VKLRDFVYFTKCISHHSVVLIIEQLLLSTITKCECWQTKHWNNYTTITKPQLTFWNW